MNVTSSSELSDTPTGFHVISPLVFAYSNFPVARTLSCISSNFDESNYFVMYFFLVNLANNFFVRER
jgi:hypothetical protein